MKCVLPNVRTVLPIVVGVTVLITATLARGAQIDALDAVVVVEAQSAACHALKAVTLDDAKRLVLRGSVCMKKNAALHRLTHHGSYVIVHALAHREGWGGDFLSARP